jgi:hypothetical protein
MDAFPASIRLAALYGRYVVSRQRWVATQTKIDRLIPGMKLRFSEGRPAPSKFLLRAREKPT